MKKKLLALIAMCVLSMGLHAQTLTVADSNVTNNRIPFYGFMSDDYCTHSQYVFPARMLQSMRNTYITRMGWYMSAVANPAMNLTLTIRMTEIQDTALTMLSQYEDMVTVWQGPFSGLSLNPVFDFDSLFTYTGGNLLVDVTTTRNQNRYTSIGFYGMPHESSAVYSYERELPIEGEAVVANFLPKTTFVYNPTGIICPAPRNLTVDSTTANFLKVSWQCDTSAHTWLVKTNNTPWETVHTRSKVFTGLNPNQEYTVEVRTLCAVDDTSTCASVTARTSCNAIVADRDGHFGFEENFETGGEVCWTMISGNAESGDNWQRTTSPAAFGASRCMYSQRSRTGVPPDEWLITTEITVPENANGLDFIWYALNRTYRSSKEYYSVKVSTSGVAPSDFTDSLVGYSHEEEWTRHSVSLTPYAGRTIHIAFHHYASENAYGVYIDSVAIKRTLIPVVNILHDYERAYVGEDIYIRAAMPEGDPGARAVVWRSSLCQSCLHATGDNLRVRFNYTSTGVDTIICTVYNRYTDNLGVSDTLILPVFDRSPVTTLPYYTGFEVGHDTNWFNNGMYNQWFIGSAANNGGQRSLYISDNGGDSNHYSDVVTANSFAERRFQLTETGDYIISYDWRSAGVENGLHFMRVFLVPGVVNYNQTNIGHYGETPEGWIDLSNGNLHSSKEWHTEEREFNIETPGLYSLVFYWYNDDYPGEQPPAAVDNVHFARLTCPAPTNVVMDALHYNGASFHWTSSGSETSWNVRVSDIDTVVNTPSCTITGLEPTTDYAINVRAICGPGDTSFALRGSFTTECSPVALPIEYDFEFDSLADPIMYMPCWRQVSTNVYRHDHEDYNLPASANFRDFVRQGARSLFFYATAENPAFITTPEINYPGNAMTVSFWTNGFIESAIGPVQGEFQAGVMTNPLDPTTFIPLLTITGATEMRQYEFSTNMIPSSAPVMVAFRCSTMASDAFLSIDDLKIEPYNPCGVVSGLRVQAIAGDNATVVWQTPEGGVTQYRVVYGKEGATPDTLNVTGTSCHLSNLEPSTRYSVMVLTLCGEGSSSWSEPVSFMSACSDITEFPFVESFERGLGCWSVVDANHDGFTWRDTTVNDDYLPCDGVHMMASYSYLDNVTYHPDDWLISPRMTLPEDIESITLSWNYYFAMFEPNADRYTVYISTSGYNEESFVPVDSLRGYLGNGGIWFERHIDLTQYAGQSIYIAFRHHDCTDQNFVMFDKISVQVSYPEVQCPKPVITAAYTTPTTATIDYSSDTSECQVFIISGSWYEPAAGVRDTDGTFTFQGLTPGTSYILAVRSVCEGGYSDWVTERMTTRQFDDPCTAPVDIVVTRPDADRTQAIVDWTPSGSETQWEVSYNDMKVVANSHPFQVTGLVDTLSYTFVVRAICGEYYYSEWSHTVGISEVMASSISLYPNPATSSVSIAGIMGKAKISLCDLNGRAVGEWDVRDGMITINVSSLARGTYFVRIVGEEFNAIRKLVVK